MEPRDQYEASETRGALFGMEPPEVIDRDGLPDISPRLFVFLGVLIVLVGITHIILSTIEHNGLCTAGSF